MDDNQHAVAELLPKGVASLRNYRWQKGQSGNPKGRPPRGYATSERIRTALAEDLPEILAKVVEKAKAGDLAAAKIIMDRVVPAYRPVEEPLAVRSLVNAGSLTAQGEAIIRAVARGEIPLGQAAQLLIGMGSQARVQEMDALKRQLDELKELVSGKAHAPRR